MTNNYYFKSIIKAFNVFKTYFYEKINLTIKKLDYLNTKDYKYETNKYKKTLTIFLGNLLTVFNN